MERAPEPAAFEVQSKRTSAMRSLEYLGEKAVRRGRQTKAKRRSNDAVQICIEISLLKPWHYRHAYSYAKMYGSAVRGAKVVVRHYLDGRMDVVYKDRLLDVTRVRGLPRVAEIADEKTLDARVDALIERQGLAA